MNAERTVVITFLILLVAGAAAGQWTSMPDALLRVSGDTMKGNLNMSFQLNNITNFFGDNCADGESVHRVWSNGTYQCVSGGGGGEDLAQTLSNGNSAGSFSIDMNNNSIQNVANDTDMVYDSTDNRVEWRGNGKEICIGNC